MDRKVKTVIEMLGNLDFIVYIVQVGSSIHEKNPKDIDLLVGVLSSSEDTYQSVCEVLRRNGIDGIERSDDALRFNFEESVFDVALYSHKNVYDIVTGVVTGTLLEGRLAHWATKAWLPEGFCADLRKGKILQDKSGILKSLIESIRSYPKIFREKILERCSLEINSKIDELGKSTPKSIERTLIRSDIIAALIRYAFAYDEVYLRSYKKLDENAKELRENGRKIFSLATQINKTDIYSIHQKIKKLLANEKKIKQ